MNGISMAPAMSSGRWTRKYSSITMGAPVNTLKPAHNSINRAPSTMALRAQPISIDLTLNPMLLPLFSSASSSATKYVPSGIRGMYQRWKNRVAT